MNLRTAGKSVEPPTFGSLPNRKTLTAHTGIVLALSALSACASPRPHYYNGPSSIPWTFIADRETMNRFLYPETQKAATNSLIRNLTAEEFALKIAKLADHKTYLPEFVTLREEARAGNDEKDLHSLER